MIAIRLNGEPPHKWLEKSAQISQQLEEASTVEERKKIIKDNEKHWGRLKPWFVKQTNRKCWFSEAKEKYSHYHIEHFRPKTTAKELDGTEREGYWWLAFDWRNFRIIGGVGNVKKGTFFPLKVGTAAANRAHRDIEGEWCYLLDPMKERDVSLITFNEEGLMEPLADISDWEKERVKVTIQLLNLNEHEPLVEARRDIWTKCSRYISNFLEAQAELGKTQDAQSKFRSAIDALKEMISENAELSSVAIACIYKRNIQRLNRVLFQPAGQAAA